MQLTVAASEITNMIEKPAGGRYIRLLREIEAQAGVRFDISVLSDRRAKRNFRDRQADAYLLGSNFDEPMSPVVVLLDQHALHAFVPKGQVPPASLDDLRGKRLGLPSPYSFPLEMFVAKGIEPVHLAESAQANLTALAHGRVDAVLIPLKAGKGFVDEGLLTELEVDLEHPVLIKQALMVFQEGYECIAKRVDAALRRMRADGALKAILEG